MSPDIFFDQIGKMKNISLVPTQALKEIIERLELVDDINYLWHVVQELDKEVRERYEVSFPVNFGDPSSLDNEEISCVSLEKIQEYLIYHFDMFENIKLRDLKMMMGGHVAAHFTREVFREKVDTVTVKYPLDWWQSFKERWFPEWLLDKHPVICHTEKFSFDVVYPDFKSAVDGNFYRVVWRMR